MTGHNRRQQRLLLNLGCGPLARKTDWIDLDGSWNVIVTGFPHVLRSIMVGLYKMSGKQYHPWPNHVKYLNILKPFPFARNSVDAIYASHVWEHLFRDEVMNVTRECCRVLKPGGVIRLVVPDLSYFCRQYLGSKDTDSSDRLMENLALRPRRRERSLIMKLYTYFTDFHTHKWMYDARSLSSILAACGFTEITEKECFESLIPEIRQVEDPGSVSATAGIALEAIKPEISP